MILQVALDLTDIETAISIAEKAARGGAHWLEVGTPLIKKEGMRAVELLKRRFPDRKIVADLKTMDTGAITRPDPAPLVKFICDAIENAAG